MKKLLATLLTLSMCLMTVSVFATPTFDDMLAAQSAGDLSALETLIRTEADLDASLKQELTIAVGDVPRGAVNMDVLGLQCEISRDGTEFLNPDTNELTDGYLYLADELYDVPVARWGGTSTNSVNLMKNIGPLSQRQDTYNVVTGDYMGGAVAMGPVEFIKSIYAINPDAKFIMVLPLWGQTPEESVQFTHFLLDDKNESTWGALRASYGIEEPVELIGYELGNENYFSAKYGATGNEEEGAGEDASTGSDADEATQIAYAETKSKEYTDRCILHIDAIRADFADMQFYANVSGGHSSRLFADPWTEGIAENLDSRINGLAFHDYYNNPGNVTGDFSEMDHIQSTYKAVAGHETNFVLTEHAIWSTGNTIYRRSHYAALTEAAYINNILWRDDVICANYHNMSGEHWSLLRKFGNQYAQDSVNYVYRLYENKLGTQLLDATKATDESMVSVLATRRDNGQVVLALVNGYQDREIDITFAFNQNYDWVYESVYTAPNNMSFMNHAAVSDIFEVRETAKNVANFTTYTLPNKSVVFLTLEPDYDTQSLLSEGFETYNAMDAAVTIASPETSKAIAGNWTLTHQSDAGYVNKNVTAQIQSSSVISGSKSLAVTDSNIAATDKRLVVAERKNIGSILEGDFTIEFSMNKGSVVNGGSLRFMIHNDGKNYYQLTLGGAKEGYVWVFNKVVDNSVTATYTGEQVTQYNANPGGYLHNMQTVRVKKAGNLVSWEIFGNRYNNHSYYGSGSHTESAPFSVAGVNPTFGFTVSRSSGTGTIYFDDVEIYKYVARNHQSTEQPVYAERTPEDIVRDTQSQDAFVVNGEPANTIYARLSGETAGDVLKLSKALPVRKLYNKGAETATVLVSNDDYSYKKLADIAPGAAFVNTLTEKAYRYIKTIGGDVTAYTALSDMGYLRPGQDMPELMARINGTDTTVAAFSVSNADVATVNGNVLSPEATGTATVTANELLTFSEDFAAYENTAVIETPTATGTNSNTISGNWVLHKYNGTVNNNPTAYMQDGALYMSGASIALTDDRLAYATYDQALSGMNHNYTLSFTGNKVSTTSGMAVKFHMHNNGQNYYQLSFGGLSDEKYVWRFDKVVNGELVSDATVLGPTYTSYNTNGDGPMHGSFTASIQVNNGTISWTIDGKRYNNQAYTATGSYTDASFSSFTSNDLRLGFCVNCNSSGYSRYCSFDNISLVGTGTANFTTANITVQDFEGVSEDFSSYTNTDVISTPLGWAVWQNQIAGDWYLRRNDGTVNTNPTAYIQDGVLAISGASLPLTSGNLSYVVYDKALPALTEDYTISFTGNKVSTTSGMAIKFHMHDHFESYYQLSFGGLSDDNYVWRFDKFENGSQVAEATVLGPAYTSYNTNGDGPMHGSFNVSVRVNNGAISWTIDGKRYNNQAYTDTGSYTDPDFCEVYSEDVRFGFAVNCNSSGYSRYCTVDNIVVSGRTQNAE